MSDLLTIGLILFAWIALNRWVLPAMGIQTCMSGGCCGDSCRIPASTPQRTVSEETSEQESGSHEKALPETVSGSR